MFDLDDGVARQSLRVLQRFLDGVDRAGGNLRFAEASEPILDRSCAKDFPERGNQLGAVLDAQAIVSITWISAHSFFHPQRAAEAAPQSFCADRNRQVTVVAGLEKLVRNDVRMCVAVSFRTFLRI